MPGETEVGGEHPDPGVHPQRPLLTRTACHFIFSVSQAVARLGGACIPLLFSTLPGQLVMGLAAVSTCPPPTKTKGNRLMGTSNGLLDRSTHAPFGVRMRFRWQASEHRMGQARVQACQAPYFRCPLLLFTRTANCLYFFQVSRNAALPVSSAIRCFLMHCPHRHI